MTLQSFSNYLSNGIVKKQRPNLERARSLIEDSKNKKEFLEDVIKNFKNQNYPNFVIEYSYDILMQIIRAKMFIDGYNSSNSHEAEVSYLKVLGFNEIDLRFMDELRYNRNGIKYYGNNFEEDYAKKVLEFLNKMYPKLLKFI